jgi:hypothetical protein
MRRSFVVAGLIAFASASGVGAQENGPKAGTWGGEASAVGGVGTLLRFHSPERALAIGLRLDYLSQKVTQTPPTTGVDFDTKTFNAQLRLGVRRYRRVPERLRTHSGISVIVGNFTGDQRGYEIGSAFESGAAYFFSPHVSLGVSSDVSVIISQTKRDLGSGTTFEFDTVNAGFSGFRLVGAVYF